MRSVFFLFFSLFFSDPRTPVSFVACFCCCESALLRFEAGMSTRHQRSSSSSISSSSSSRSSGGSARRYSRRSSSSSTSKLRAPHVWLPTLWEAVLPRVQGQQTHRGVRLLLLLSRLLSSQAELRTCLGCARNATPRRGRSIADTVRERGRWTALDARATVTAKAARAAAH